MSDCAPILNLFLNARVSITRPPESRRKLTDMLYMNSDLNKQTIAERERQAQQARLAQIARAPKEDAQPLRRRKRTR